MKKNYTFSFWALLLLVCFRPGDCLAEAVEMDLISPSTCQPRLYRLVGCKFGPCEIAASGIKSTLVPLKTTLDLVTIGNCSTQFPVAVQITSERDPASSVQVIAVHPGRTVLRTTDRKSVGGLKISDASSWNSVASFHQTCRSHLKIEQDIVDVDSKEQAFGIIRKAIVDLDSKYTLERAFEELVGYRTAFELFWNLSQNVYRQLTSNSIEELLEDTDSLSSVLSKMKTSNQLQLDEDEQTSLSKVIELIEILKSRRNLGSKRLSDYLNSRDLVLVDRLAQNKNAMEEYTALKKRYAKERLEICQELSSAKILLKTIVLDQEWESFNLDKYGCLSLR